MKGNHKKKKAKDLTPTGVARAATVELTKFIKEIGSEFHTVDDEGRPLTKVESLARLVWNKALGYREKDVESDKEIVHYPDRAFIGMLWDRLEGRVAPAVQSKDGGKAKLSERIGEQSKRRLNQMSKEKSE